MLGSSKSISGFDPRSVGGCTLWLDAADSTIATTSFSGAPTFNGPQGVTRDSSGNIYVADWRNNNIRKITPAGGVTTFVSGLSAPVAICVDSSDNFYVSNQGAHTILKITLAGVVTTLAGSGIGQFADGTGTAASFRTPDGIAVDSAGNVYVSDYSNCRIRKITPAGVVTTLAGNGTASSVDGTGTGATFAYPRGIAVDSAGNLYSVTTDNKVRKITPGGVVTTFAGSGTGASTNGTGTGASFYWPFGISIDTAGNLYVSEFTIGNIRKVTPGAVVTTLAGSGMNGFADGQGTAASFNSPQGMVVDPSGNVYVADTGNKRIRKITSTGLVSTFAGSGTSGSTDSTISLIITDKSSSAYTATGFTTTAGYPAVLAAAKNGNSAIQLVAGSGFSIPSFAISPTLSTFMVYYPKGQATSSPTIEQGINATTTAGFLVQSQTPNFVIFSGTASTLTGTNTTTLNTWKMLTAVNRDTSSATSNMSVYSNATLSASNVTQAGTTVVTSTLFINGRSGTTTNSYASYLGELLIFSNALTGSQRRAIEGYLAWKWGLNASIPATHPLYSIKPFTRVFSPLDIAGCKLWLDAADGSTMNSTTTVTSWLDKSGTNNTMTGTAALSGRTITFNGSTQAFSNTAFIFPNTAFSIFAVFSNTTAPASTAYMNVLYGSNGYPMVGVYDVNKYVSMRGVVGNTGALVANVAASSNIILSATYTGTTLSPFVNATAKTALTATVAATTGLYVGGPSNYFNGSVSEILIYGGTLSTSQRQQIEGYLSAKWGLNSTLISTQPFKVIPPSTLTPFVATSPGSCTLTLSGLTGGTIRWGSSSSNVDGYVWYVGTGSQTGAFINGLIASPTTYTASFTYALATATSYYAWVAPYNLGGAGTIVLSAAAVTPNPSIAASLSNTQDAFVSCYSTSGAPKWIAQISGNGGDSGQSITTDSSGNIFVSGSNNGTTTVYNANGTSAVALAYAPTHDAFLVKYSSTGSVLWAVQISAPSGIDKGNSVATDSSGNVFITGSCGTGTLTLYNVGGGTGATLTNIGGQDGFLAKYSSAGSVLWAAQIGGPSTEQGLGVATDSSGNVFVVGSYAGSLTLYNTGGSSGATLTTIGGVDTFLAKYSSAGSVLWAAQISSTADDIGYGVATDSSGNVFVTGYYSASLTLYNTGGATGATLTYSGAIACFLAKYSAAGSVLWAARITGANLSYGNSVATDSTGNVFITGYHNNTILTLYNTGNTVGTTLNIVAGQDCFIAKYSSTGSVLWATRIGGTGNDIGYGAITDSSGNLFVTGLYTSTSAITLSNSSGTASSYILPISANYGTSNTQFIVSYTNTGDVLGAISFRPDNPTGTSAGLGIAISGSNIYTTGNYRSRGLVTMQSNNYVYPSLTVGGTLSLTWQASAAGNGDSYLVKYGPYGNTLWATHIPGGTSSTIQMPATDPSGNVFVAGYYVGSLTLYNTGGATGTTLANTTATTSNDAFLAKYSSAGSVVWATRVGGTINDYIGGLSTDSSGNAFVAGTFTSPSITLYNTGGGTGATMSAGGTNDYFFAKYSAAGSLLWAAHGDGTGTVYGAATDPSGNFFAYGYFSSITVSNTGGGGTVTLTNGGILNGFLVKYSSAGSVLWATKVGSVGVCFLSNAFTDSSGNIFVTGNYDSNGLTLFNVGGGTGATLVNSGAGDAFLGKYSSAGSVLWATRIASTAADQGYAVATDLTGSVFIVGVFGAALTVYNTGGGTGATLAYTSGLANGFVVKYSSLGLVSWAAKFVGAGGNGVNVDSNGNVFIIGSYSTSGAIFYNANGSSAITLTSAGGSDSYLVKYSTNGLALWAANIGGLSNEGAIGVATDSSGNAFVTGNYYFANTSAFNAI